MPRPYSSDLRDRVVAAVLAGESCRAVAARFEIAVSSVVKWHQRYRSTGSVAPGKMGGHRKRVLVEHRDFIHEQIKQTPHLTRHGMITIMGQEYGAGLPKKYLSELRAHRLLIRPKKNYTKTTFSKHWIRKHPNLLVGRKPSRPEQVFVSDITYVESDEGVHYLSLVTDAFSRKIMGHMLSHSMAASEVVRALKQAMRNRSEGYGITTGFAGYFATLGAGIALSAFANARLVMLFGSARILTGGLFALTGIAGVFLITCIVEAPPFWMFHLFMVLLMSAKGLVSTIPGAVHTDGSS